MQALIFGVAVALQSAPAGAAVPVAWTPSHQAARCTVQREVATTSGRVTVALQAVPLGSTYRLLALEPSSETGLSRAGTVTIRADSFTRTERTVNAPVPDLSARLIRADLPRRLFDSFEGSAIAFEPQDGMAFSLSAADLAAGLSMLHDCEAEIIAEWGIDPVQLAAVAVPPEVIDRSGPIRGRPSKDLPKDAAGTVIELIDIGKDGRVNACKTVQTSGNDKLDDATCRIFIEKVRYRPARDSADRPVHSWMTESIDWTGTS